MQHDTATVDRRHPKIPAELHTKYATYTDRELLILCLEGLAQVGESVRKFDELAESLNGSSVARMLGLGG